MLLGVKIHRLPLRVPCAERALICTIASSESRGDKLQPDAAAGNGMCARCVCRRFLSQRVMPGCGCTRVVDNGGVGENGRSGTAGSCAIGVESA